ncbi:sphingosine-1-phosphate transporter MFSD2B-like [Branchiostoma lanceolatum]|uniref:sphingosine-1-phosphate transporter MFSD2B-like n=1 Tax=Branchiostoma lanceolatum TaxID=7740 RepID=UPI0034553228
MAALLGVTERKDTVVDISTPDEPVLKTLRVMFTFKPFLYASGIYLCYGIATSTIQQGLALYIQYSLNLGDMVEIYLTVATASVVVGIPIVKLLLDRFGRKTICVGSALVLVPLLVGLIFIQGSLAVNIPFLIVYGVASSGLFMLPW